MFAGVGEASVLSFLQEDTVIIKNKKQKKVFFIVWFVLKQNHECAFMIMNKQ